VGFYGLVSSAPFDHIVLTAGPQAGIQETYDMDNMIYGGVAAVPDSSQFVWLTPGILCLVHMIRRRLSIA